jgi:hypothetical protein
VETLYQKTAVLFFLKIVLLIYVCAGGEGEKEISKNGDGQRIHCVEGEVEESWL